MTALLVLLALLSLAMLASSQGAFDELVARAATPVLVVAGLALSPAGLGFFTADTLHGLDPAVDVGVAWLALLAGVRASAAFPSAVRTKEGRRSSALAALASLVVALVTGAVLQAADGLAIAHLDAGSVAPAALLVGASLAGMPGDRTKSGARSAFAATAELVVLVAALGSYVFWAGTLHAGVVVAVGFVGAVVVQLVLPSRHTSEANAVPPAIAYLAVCVLVAGLCRLAALPSAVAGFVFGAVTAHLSRTNFDALLGTERPVRIVVTILLAAATPMTMSDAVTGAALGIALVLVQYFVSLALVDGSSLLARLGATVATSTTPLIAVAAFADANVDGVKLLMPAVIVAVAVADAFAFTMSLASSRAPPPAHSTSTNNASTTRSTTSNGSTRSPT